MDGIADGLFSIWFELDWKLDGLRIGLPKIAGLLFDLPVDPAVEVFDNANFHRFRLVIAQGDLKGFVDPRSRTSIRPRVGDRPSRSGVDGRGAPQINSK